MAKISPVSIKYMIHANFTAEGALEKPDVIGAVFGQTEGLLGADLEMRELQKEGKIGRIEVELERKNKKTTGTIKIPTALDQSETTLIAAAIETIERIGPSDAQIEVEKIEDVRGSKREYILERAKKLMQEIEGSSNSREISKEIKESTRMGEVSLYGEEQLPSGDLSEKEIIVVEGRADVLNLMKNGIKNVIAMNGTKLPDAIKKLSKEKEITLFVDGDRGGKLIIQNVTDNADIKYIAMAPDGKEVEELTGKEILMNLRKKVKTEDYFGKNKYAKEKKSEESEKIKIKSDEKKKLKELSDKNKGSGKAILLNESLEEIKKIPEKTLINSLKRMKEKPLVVIIDGIVTNPIIKAAEEARVQAIVAKNFATTDTNIQLLSL
ncbi:DNA primase [Candidatus Pacearchaeota archaeon]|nr:MAG: DNA primase [Candidatus Pacearchaeota archaeon]